MKIALLNPPWPHPSDPNLWGVRAGSRWPHFQRRVAPGRLPRYIPFPFFLAITASVLREAGHNILLLDGIAENLSMELFHERIAAFEPELIFVETSTPSLAHDLRMMVELRKNCRGAWMAMGGTHPASLAAELFKLPSAPDFWIAGEYEISLKELARALAGGNFQPCMPGIMFEGGKSWKAGDSPDVNALPAPLFESLPIASYSDPVCGLPSPGAQSWLSRGCPYGCTFCVWPQVVYGNRRYRPRRLDLALDEVELLLNRYKCESFYFDDDTANIGEERMIELAGAIKRRGLNSYPWSMMARADCMTPRMLGALADAGMYSVKYGVESSSPALLNACEKGTRWDRLQEALRLTRELGIKIHLTFTLGVPGESPETIQETIQFALKTAPDTSQFSICTPFPGTTFYEQCRKQGWLVSDDWERFLGSGEAVVNTPWLTSKQLQEGYNEALSCWNEFVSRRLLVQQAQLKFRVLEIAAAGSRWHLNGEREFASFLPEQDPALVAMSAGNCAMDKSVFEVIVSRHDEEKIRRRLLRSGVDAAHILCLYSRLDR